MLHGALKSKAQRSREGGNCENLSCEELRPREIWGRAALSHAASALATTSPLRPLLLALVMATQGDVLEQEASIVKMLGDIGQEHLVSGWGAGAAAEDKRRFLEQVTRLNGSYPGGLKNYVESARKLLADSKAGVNPLEGWHPSVPQGVTLSFGSDDFVEHEGLGLQELDGCSFVLVAGGLGERLGYSGIKVALPWQISSEETYLAL